MWILLGVIGPRPRDTAQAKSKDLPDNTGTAKASLTANQPIGVRGPQSRGATRKDSRNPLYPNRTARTPALGVLTRPSLCPSRLPQRRHLKGLQEPHGPDQDASAPALGGATSPSLRFSLQRRRPGIVQEPYGRYQVHADANNGIPHQT